MLPDAALLLLSVTTAFVLISAQSTCRNTVYCLCGSRAEKFRVCADQNTTAADPCIRWPGCKTCEGGSDDPSCSTATNRILRSRRKRQYASYSRERWSPFSTNPERWARQSEAAPAVTCPDPGQVANADRLNTDGSPSLGVQTYRTGQSVAYTCRARYALQRGRLITCQTSGSWSNSLPYCRRIRTPTSDGEFCLNPGSIQNGKIHYYPNINSQRVSENSLDNPEYPPNSRMVYSCNGGYRLQGASEMTCLGDTGLWSIDPPTCVRASSRIMIYCDDPGPIINGRVQHFPPAKTPRFGKSISEDNLEYPEGTKLQYLCDDGFVLIGPPSLSCLPTSDWSSDPPICSAECGRSSAESIIHIFNGTVSRAGLWPWVVSIRENKDSDIVCGGAVLNSRTVVTAAHCLTGSDSYILYFGKIHKLDKEDDEKVMVRTSNRIIIHPYYSDKSMDSDIGLIHFKDRIRFTDSVQSICLPDTFTTAKDLRSGRIGFVAGFGENERGLQPNDLMQARIPVQDNEVCVEYYRKEGITLNMTQNMFCAGYAGADQGTCQGDSGSALVFFDRTTERFTLEGLVSFATNGQCGVSGRYIVFTKVIPYVPWLLANLA